MNKIDMNKLFTEDILSVGIPVRGETDDYVVTIAFGGLLELLREEIEKSGVLTFREVTRAVINGLNREDVYISCTCPDSRYRMQYYQTVNGYNSGPTETRPSKITNPNDTLGSGCKHTLLVLNNNSWAQRLSRTIYNYIEYMRVHYQRMYADKIYPAIYGKEYEEPVQLSIIDNDELDSTSDTIDTANRWRRDSTRFRPGNQSGIQFARNNNNENQISLENELENEDDII